MLYNKFQVYLDSKQLQLKAQIEKTSNLNKPKILKISKIKEIKLRYTHSTVDHDLSTSNKKLNETKYCPEL